MKPKTRFSMMICLLLIILLTTTVINAAELGKKIVIYNVAGFNEVYKDQWVLMFQQKYGYTVEYVTGKFDEVITKLKSQQAAKAVNINIVITGIDGLPLGMEQGVFTQLLPTYSKTVGMNSLNKVAQGYARRFSGYGIPLFVNPGGPCFVYDTMAIKKTPKDIQELKKWIIANPKKFQYATPRTSGPGRSFVIGLAYALGESVDEPEKWVKTWDYLKEIDLYIDGYPAATGDLIRSFSTGLRTMMPMGPSWQATIRADGTVPNTTGTYALKDTAWVMDAQCITIPKGLKEADLKASLDYLKFALSKESQDRITAEVRIASNSKSTPEKLAEMQKNRFDSLANMIPESMRGQGVLKSKWVFSPSPTALKYIYDEWDKRFLARK